MEEPHGVQDNPAANVAPSAHLPSPANCVETVNQRGTFGDDLISAILAVVTGTVFGLPTWCVTGFFAFVLIENDCSGEYMCGLGAGIGGILIGFAFGLLVFIAAAIWSLRRHAGPGRRLRVALLAFVGIPVFLALVSALIGLA